MTDSKDTHLNHNNETVGFCERCDKIVLESNLFVEKDEKFYHLSCYNEFEKVDTSS